MSAKAPLQTMSELDTNRGKPPVEPIIIDDADKPHKQSIAELRDGKLVFKQKCLSLAQLSETMQEIVKFREMLEHRVANNEDPLDEIPEEHKPVIAKLVQESDKSLITLAKHVQAQLLPLQSLDEDEEEPTATDPSSSPAAILPLTTIERAVRSIAKRVNYGLETQTNENVKIPASLCVWRWEVKEELRARWLPKASREKAEARWRERVEAKRDIQAAFEALSQDDRDKLVPPKTDAKHVKKSKEKDKGANAMSAEASESTPKTLTKRKNGDSNLADGDNGENVVNGAGTNDADSIAQAEGSSSSSPPKARSKKPVDPEQAAKEKERQEKKLAKAEKEKKAKEAQNKSRSLMASFFNKNPSKSHAADVKGKSKSVNGGTLRVNDSKPSSSPKPGVSSPGQSSMSEFERTFKPFARKKGVEIAPANWFLKGKGRKDKETRKRLARELGDNIIIIDHDDDEDVEMKDVQEVEVVKDLERMSAKARLKSILSTLPPSLNPHLRSLSVHSHYSPAHPTVRDLLTQLTEAELAGDVSRVRHLLDTLRSRSQIPAKVFCFHEDARPGYFGTFTRTSREVGPRRPFARDVAGVDYSYDSGEEWEEEGEGEEVVGGGSDEEEEKGTLEEDDSDLDGWLVSDDEVDEVGTPIEEREAFDFGFDFDPLPPQATKEKKRKQVEGKEREGEKKRKVIVPLVPFSKGPVWEETVGKCEYGPFERMRIQLFNDTPFPIDPFTFVSTPPLLPSVASVNKGAATTSTDAQFTVPSLPTHLQKLSISASTSTGTPSGSKPRVAFPDAHLPTLLSKIRASSTGNLIVLVENLYASFQEEGVKVTKKAIEAKVKEVGEKCRVKKVWVVKGEGEQFQQPQVAAVGV